MSTSTFSDQDFAFERGKVKLNSSRELPVFLTLKKVAELLKVKPRTVYAWVSVEEFHTSVGGCCAFDLMLWSLGISRIVDLYQSQNSIALANSRTQSILSCGKIP